MSQERADDVSLPGGEVWGGPWRSVPIADFTAGLRSAHPGGRPTVVAVDGRSASGKTTLAVRLVEALADAALVHTDDVAWWHGFFDWDDLMRTGVLEPLHRGEAVAFVPPAWVEHDREPGERLPSTWPDGIVVPASTRFVVIEGVGSSRRELADLVDTAIWVQADEETRAARDAARVAAGETTARMVDEWQRKEVPFLADQRPWDRADHVVASTPGRLTAGVLPEHAGDLMVGRSST